MHILDFLDTLEACNNPRLRGNKTLGSATAVYNYRVLRSIFHWACEWKVIKISPMNGVPARKDSTKEMAVYDDHEVREVFAALQSEKPMLRILIALALTTGLRRGELLGLEWKHIDLDKGVIDIRQSIPMFKDGQPLIKVPKTKNSIRKVAIPLSITQEMRSYYELMLNHRTDLGDKWLGGEHFFLFSNMYGIPYYPKTLSDKWSDFIKRNSNLKYIRFHDLRHTSATLLINQGVHPKIISSRLGHSKIATTMDVYGHAIQSADFAAASTFDSLLNTDQ